MSAEELHLVIPGPLHQRTGGYLYDARMVRELRELGWTVQVHSVDGSFPGVDEVARQSLAAALAALPEGAITVVDGLALCALPDVAAAAAPRLRLVALVHHPLGDETGLDEAERERFLHLETRTLAAVDRVLVTSEFTARRLQELGVDGSRIRVVVPGTDRPTWVAEWGPADPAVPAPADPLHFLCVGTVTPRKGQDLLVQALARIAELPWTCTCAGSTDRDRAWASSVMDAAERAGLGDRIDFAGELPEAELEALYREAHVFVLPSWYEGYGMALTEALVHGLPVVSTTGGAIPWTVPDDTGFLVEPGDVDALTEALRRVIQDGAFRAGLSEAARRGGERLPSWPDQAARFADALTQGSSHDTFEPDWLTLREPVDHRSRAHAFADRLGEMGADRGWSRAVDLGTGTGSNLRYLSTRLPWVREWTAVDHDARVLAALEWSGDAALRTVTGDLRTEGLEALDGAHLVTASALLDLVTEDWLTALARRLAHPSAPGGDSGADPAPAVLFALSYDGSVRWGGEPHPHDALVREAVNRHQEGEKGLGRALGPRAAQSAARILEGAGYTVELAPTPWVMAGVGDAALALELMDGWVGAALEARPGARREIEGWIADRRAQVTRGDFHLEVGHLDLLALPA